MMKKTHAVNIIHVIHENNVMGRSSSLSYKSSQILTGFVKCHFWYNHLLLLRLPSTPSASATSTPPGGHGGLSDSN